MLKRLPLFLDLDKHGMTSEDIVQGYFRCAPSDIQKKVIIMPVWHPHILQEHVTSMTTVFEGPLQGVWNLEYGAERVTLIRSGMSAAFTGDAVLALGCTACDTLLFAGSVGGLRHDMEIGDLVVARESVCGEGFSRYLSHEVIPQDRFLDLAQPDASLTDALMRVAQQASQTHSVPLHAGTIFCTDTILAQFSRLDYLVAKEGCIGIEMETSATFNAAALVGIRAAALLQVSDVTTNGKSLFSGRTREEMSEKARIKETILAKILLETLAG